MTKTVILTFGYKNAGGTHRRVTFGRRPTGEDLMLIGDSPESLRPVQFQLLQYQAAITSFEGLQNPVPLSALLSLNKVDRDDLGGAYAEFIREGNASRSWEKRSDSTYKIGFGFQIGDQVFDVVEFGKLLTGYEELAAEDYESWRQACFLMGAQITRLSQSEGSAVHTGPVTVEHFKALDAEDVYKLQAFLPGWYDSFRLKGGDVPGDAGGGGGVSDEAPAPPGGGGSELEH